MAELWQWLQGKKTYIAAAITTILGVLQSDAFLTLNLIPVSWQGWIAAVAMIFAGLTVAAGRHSNAKIQSAQVELADIAMDAMDLTQTQKADALAQTTTLKLSANPKGNQ